MKIFMNNKSILKLLVFHYLVVMGTMYFSIVYLPKIESQAYWSGWHQGKQDQYQDDQKEVIDGESGEVQ